METPHLDIEIKNLENLSLTKELTGLAKDALAEYKAIKKQLENNPIVSTPDNPVWVMDELRNKCILLADFGENCISRYFLVPKDYEDDFLSGGKFNWSWTNHITPYTEKVNIEVTQEEAVKVEEFLKTLRNGN